VDDHPAAATTANAAAATDDRTATLGRRTATGSSHGAATADSRTATSSHRPAAGALGISSDGNERQHNRNQGDEHDES
jgi:hypothetical protein